MACAVSATIGSWLPRSRSIRVSVYPSISGIWMSVRSSAYGRPSAAACSSISSAMRPFCATSTSAPAFRRWNTMMYWLSRPSSASRILPRSARAGAVARTGVRATTASRLVTSSAPSTGTSGSSRRKHEPCPGAVRASTTEPPSSCASLCEIARPRPEPPWRRVTLASP